VLGDVQATIQLVEKNRDNFQQIDNKELYERKALVSTSVERVNMAKQEMNSGSVKEKLGADFKAKSLRRGYNGNTTNGGSSQNGFNDQANEFIANAQSRASLMLMQQDEALEDLDMAVVRVGHMAENIHEEIGQQNKMLDEMDADLADAEEQLGVVMGKLAKLLKTKNKCHLGTILCLLGVVIVLFLLVLYT
jgi:syntaxin 6